MLFYFTSFFMEALWELVDSLLLVFIK